MNKTAVEWLYESLILNESNPAYNNWVFDKAKLIEKDQLCALYLTLLLNTPDIAQFDFEEWYKQNTTHE